MSDISVTAANVIRDSTALTETGTCGGTITAGQPLYKDTTALDSVGNPKLKLADCNASLATSRCAGISLHGAVDGQPITYLTVGPYTCGATVVKGTVYVVSANAGGIAPASDLASGHYTSIIGVATSTTVIYVNRFNSEAQI